MTKINGVALAATGAGALFMYSGVKGVGVIAAIQALVSGQSPAGLPVTNPINPGPPSSAGGAIGGGSPVGTTTGSAIADDALQYQGHCYLFGGAPGRDGKSCWDCSSFVNWVLGHDLGLAIPGFKTYDGTVHGPATGNYMIWAGGQHIPHSQLAAGDLVVGFSHMGIAITNTTYISAHDPAERTTVTPISHHFPDPTWLAIRVKAAVTPAVSSGKLNAVSAGQ